MSDILAKATSQYESAKDGWADIYKKARDDLDFVGDGMYCQWEERTLNDRLNVKQPVVQIDQLGQFIHQVVNDIRMNTPTIKVIPVGSGTDVETAEMIEGRIKAIEYKSNADSAYDMAAEFAVKSGIGFIRVCHDYAGEDGFEQELQIKRVINPSAVYIDPNSTEPDGSDAEFAFVLDDITVDEFMRRYPKAAVASFGEKAATNRPELHEKITIAEYFYIEKESKEYGLKEDGSIEEVIDGVSYERTRTAEIRKVMHCWLSGEDVLEEPSPFPGKYIPVVPVYGEESWIDGKRNLFSLIRKSKSAQRMYNLWKSLETELLLKQQQAPVQAAVGQMRNFEDDWAKPDKAMVLYYHQTDASGQPAPPPQRLAPPAIPTGIVNAARETVDDIKATMGLYNASIGQRSNESSGIAIQRRQQEGDVATFHFGDNLVKAITHVGKIIVSALPEIEDTSRVVQIVGREDEPKSIGINGAIVDGQERTYDFTKGKWDVRVVTGAPFTTQRQEAAAFYADIIGKMPDMMPAIGDLVFKYQDAPGAQAISARLKKLVDPKLLDEKEREDMGVDPEKMQMQAAMQEMQAQLQQAEQLLAQKGQESQLKVAEIELKARIETEKSQLEREKLAIELEKVQNERLKIQADIEKNQMDAQLRVAEMQQPQQQPEMNIPKGLQVTKTPEALAMEDSHHASMMAMKEQELLQEQEEMARREQIAMADIQARDIQTQAIMQAINSLASTIAQPKTVIYDANGQIIGVK